MKKKRQKQKWRNSQIKEIWTKAKMRWCCVSFHAIYSIRALVLSSHSRRGHSPFMCAQTSSMHVAVWTVWCLELNKSQRKGFSSLSFIHPQSILIVHIQGERARKCLDVLRGKEIGCHADEEIENVILLVYLMSSSMLSKSHFFFGANHSVEIACRRMWHGNLCKILLYHIVDWLMGGNRNTNFYISNEILILKWY